MLPKLQLAESNNGQLLILFSLLRTHIKIYASIRLEGVNGCVCGGKGTCVRFSTLKIF